MPCRFSAAIAFLGTGRSKSDEEHSQNRTYKVFGKVDLSDSVWLKVKDNTSLYRFFKVEVESK